MATQIKLRRDTAANWTASNPVLALGEPGIETNTRKIKYGDGTTAWTALAYSAGDANFTGDYNDLTNKPTIPSVVGLATETYVDEKATWANISDKPTFSTVAASGEYKDLIWTVYQTIEDLPDATTNHGMFAHVHAEGHGYMAHAGNWVKLGNYSDIPGGLADLSDVIITGAATGQVLKYNGTAWVNDTDATSGGASTGDITFVNNTLTGTGDIKLHFTPSASPAVEFNFASNGRLTLPTGGDIVNSTGTSVLGGSGTPGADGASAYEIAVANGFVGNEAAWLASLVGAPGADGLPGAPGADGLPGAPGADALWNFTGAYGGGTSYAIGDVATHNGETWYRLNANGGTVGNVPAEGIFWTKIAAQGAAGADGLPGADGAGVVAGGTAGQVLAKIDGTDYNTAWVNQTGSSTNEITNTDGTSTYSVSVATTGVITMNTARGGIEFGAMPEVGGPEHLHIMRPAGQNGSTDLFFGDDYNYVKLPGLYSSNPDSQQGVEIGSSLSEGTVSKWQFKTNGDLQLPAGGDIVNSSGTSVLGGGGTTLPADASGYLNNNGSGTLTWVAGNPAGSGILPYSDVKVFSATATGVDWQAYTLSGTMDSFNDYQGTIATITLSAQDTYGTQVASGSKALWINDAKIDNQNYVVVDFPATPTVGDAFNVVINSSVATVNAGSLVIGQTYTIASVGTTNWTTYGASYNGVGAIFVATGAGTGTGTVTTSVGAQKAIYKVPTGHRARTMQQGNSPAVWFGQGGTYDFMYADLSGSTSSGLLTFVYAGLIEGIPSWYQVYF